jgi:hypothetical protein
MIRDTLYISNKNAKTPEVPILAHSFLPLIAAKSKVGLTTVTV